MKIPIITTLFIAFFLSISAFPVNAIGRTTLSYKDPEGSRLTFKIPVSKLRKVNKLISQKYPDIQCDKWMYDPHKEIYFRSCARDNKKLEIHLYKDHSITKFENNAENVIGDWNQ